MTHDHGLPHDLQILLSRRRALGMLTVVGASGLLAACGDGPPDGERQAEVIGTAADGAECVAAPTETAGPYPADGSNRAHGELANVLKESGVVRTDLRPSFGDVRGEAEGVPFELTISLQNVSSNCAPLSGYAIYLWHCDAMGRYSLYDLEEANYLRGVGVTGADGAVRFTTIVPGCYAGRYPHMHFEVYPSLPMATDYRNRVLTSQMAMPGDMSWSVYEADARYAGSLENLPRSTLERDGIFSDNTPKQQAAITPFVRGDAAGGYSGTVVIGLAV